MALVTPLKTAAEQALAQQFSESKPRLPGNAVVQGWREAAFAGFEAKGLPHRRLESWHYTDLRTLLREARPLAAGAKVTEALSQRLTAFGLEGPKLVLVDGVFSTELSTLAALPKGITVRSLADALGSATSELTEALSGPGIAGDDAALMLNAALVRDGVVVEIAAGTKLPAPLALISLVTGAAEQAVFTRSIIRAGDDVEGTIVEISESGGPEASQINAALVIETGDGSALEHVRIVTRQPTTSVQVQSLLATIGAGAKFDSFALVCDAATLRQQHFIRFAGEHSELGLRGVNLLRDSEHSDVTLVVDHEVPHGTSRELFKSIIGGEGTGAFQGKVIVRPHAQKTDGSMKSNALLLNDGASMFNKPELEIFADDVICGHGATVAQIDGEQLFYLMARGLPRQQAEALVLQAFAGEAVGFIADEGVRAMVMGEVESWLAAHERIDAKVLFPEGA